jgi:ADP-ribosylglycohydrolase
VLEFEKHPEQPYAAITGELARHGNGSLMRLSAAPLSAAGCAGEAMRRAVDSGRTTHGSHLAVDCCRYFTALLLGALAGVTKEHLLAPLYTPRTCTLGTSTS